MFVASLTLAGLVAATGVVVPDHQLTIEVDAASVGVGYAWRAGPTSMLGLGLAAGPTPLLGLVVTSNDHYDIRDEDAHYVGELAALQGFVRLFPQTWLRLDLGARLGAFVHFARNISAGPALTAFAAPAVGTGWFWIGPRVAVGGLVEEQGNPSFALFVDALIAKVAFSW